MLTRFRHWTLSRVAASARALRAESASLLVPAWLVIAIGALLGVGLSARPAMAVQQASLQGIVSSGRTGAPLEGTIIVLLSGDEELRSTVSDRNGFYQIGGIAPGDYTLRAQYFSVQPFEQTVTLSPGELVTFNIELSGDAISLEGITVTAPGGGGVVRDLGRQRITPAQLRTVPVPSGTGDLATYLQTLPGVVTTGDRGGQIFIRGGTAADNLILIDGAPIFQPFHIFGFYSVFPEDLVSSVDFYAGGFGPRYTGRSSSVIDVQLRDGDPTTYRSIWSGGLFLAEGLVEGPLGDHFSWLVSGRRSLVEETSRFLLGNTQPITFSSQLLKVSTHDIENLRCSGLALRTSDKGRLDPEAWDSYVAWRNLVLGGRCVALFNSWLRLVEINFSYSRVENNAVIRGSGDLLSAIRRLQHDAHTTNMIWGLPLYAGYVIYVELVDHHIVELFGLQRSVADVSGIGGYVETSLGVEDYLEVRPGVALTALPRRGAEPRIRASLQPFGRPSEKLQAAFGVYLQDLVGASDMRDVSSVFVSWMRDPDLPPMVAVQGMMGWQQTLGDAVNWSLEGYYKRLRDVSVPKWSAVAEFGTELTKVDGEAYGLDARVEWTTPRFYGFAGYSYGWVEYEGDSEEFGTWFGETIQRFHPPHDRRHQANVVANLEVADFTASLRWQFGSGLPYTRPLGFDEAFDFRRDLQDVTAGTGTTRMILDRPFTHRLPLTHRLDIAVRRSFAVKSGVLEITAGAINVYDRRNMFFYDLYSGRRVDQLPLMPYAAITLRAD
ncbi:MAG TPA: TonB-dependent receptor [Longimicrobiales bacterium]|nr:TonB-dependent receptor [Longimicrobiales bacterium]